MQSIFNLSKSQTYDQRNIERMAQINKVGTRNERYARADITIRKWIDLSVSIPPLNFMEFVRESLFLFRTRNKKKKKKLRSK